MDPKRETLLVVDDNEENRDMLGRRLERKGFTVLTAEGGQQAVEMIAKQPVDLVLLDIMMPGMTGLEVLKILRAAAQTADLPVIMATAKTESADVIEALELGANDYVTKPLDFPVVLARVQAQLRLRRRPGPASGSASSATTTPGPTPAAVQPGVVLAERYRLETKLGSGSFGTVYRARHLELEHVVAVKVLQASVTGNDEALTRFRREGISACRVKHPNAVGVLDFGITPEGVAYLVMELLDGESLLDELNRHHKLSPARVGAVIIPVCDALADAHRAGIIHRDIKPSNIFLQRTARGEVPKVLDFGIAKISGETTTGQNLTTEGSVLGTLAYMAPERFSTRPVDGKCDIYSLGVSMFQMLAGRLPFVAPDSEPMALIMMHMNEPPPALSPLAPEVSPALEAVVQQALRKDPAQRPTAEELADNLARALGVPRDFATISEGPTSALLVSGFVSPEGPTLIMKEPASQFTPLDEPTLIDDRQDDDDEE
jgi:serine/threonine protein kinase/DNA-binding NarL/FixJ family response regulator